MKSVAVIGTGYWGKNLVRNFYSLGALQAVCDTSELALTAMKKLYPDVRMETSFAAILADPDIVGIAIATPAPMHAPMIRQSFLSGKDVYVEKPLCLSEREGQELNALAQEKNKVLMVGHLLWFHPAVIKLQELIKDGRLGRIQYIYSNRLNLGKLRREENVLWSFAPHDISIILGLVEEMPDSVYAQGGNFLHQHIADTTTSLFSFPSGIQAHIFVSWLHPFKEQKLVVVGERQMAVFDDQAPWQEKLQLYPHSIEWSGSVPVANKAQVAYVKITEKEPLQEECSHFLDCIHNRRSPKTDGTEGLRVLKVLNACQRSMELGKKIELAPSDNLQKIYFIHNSSVVDDNVEVGEKSKIWHFSHLLSGVRVGKSCNIGQNVVIGPNVTIGNGCKIQNNISIYEGVTLEDEVFCGPSIVFTNVMNPRAAISRKDEFRPTLVKKGATLGANSTIVTGVTIGEYSFVGAGAVVIAPVPDFALVVGNPARQIGWMSKHGERLDLPLAGSPAETVCPVTGDYYRFEKGKVTLMRTENP